jgi:hypothetical protein
MTENILVFLIAGIAFLMSARWLYHTLAGKSEGCGCGENSCPTAASGESIKDANCRK